MAEIKLQKRYKYAGDVFQELVEHAGFQPEVAAALLNDIPDADVAPRAEVEKIFEEIEDVINNIGYFDELDFEALKKKYAEGQK